ncbi:MAG: GNAT family N-acetyltransferase [Cyanobacteria bacterium J06600_6]
MNYPDRKEEARIKVELIPYQSPEFQQAAQIRYDLFFAEHDLPWSITQDSNQVNYFHAAILHDRTVIAYGQLVPNSDRPYQICQMVVKPEYQGQGLGKKILLFLIEQAQQEQAISLTLNARLTAVEFYQKLGFQTSGNPFPSDTTGVMHITMNRNL